jgi:hypothetical protein
MKLLIFIVALFSSTLVAAQNPYARLNNEFRSLFDPVPIDKGEEQEFFNYGIKLFEQDSLKKSGQIFDRIYWLDTSAYLAKQSLLYRKKIEKKIIQQTQHNLNSIWNWSWSGTNWGPNDSPAETNKTKHIQLDGAIIKFYRNDTLVRQTKYVLTQNFNWVNGFLSNHLQYVDNNEQWYFNLTTIASFTSDRLWIEQKSNYVCGNYGECYLFDRRIRTADIGIANVIIR